MGPTCLLVDTPYVVNTTNKYVGHTKWGVFPQLSRQALAQGLAQEYNCWATTSLALLCSSVKDEV